MWQSPSQHHTQRQKAESISTKIRNKRRMLSILLSNIALEVIAKALRQERDERNTDWKRRETVNICRWHVNIYRESKKLLEIMCKVAVYKINTEKSTVFLYTVCQKGKFFKFFLQLH